jgi:uncharacterized protein YaaW (UPF0174 family)
MLRLAKGRSLAQRGLLRAGNTRVTKRMLTALVGRTKNVFTVAKLAVAYSGTDERDNALVGATTRANDLEPGRYA